MTRALQTTSAHHKVHVRDTRVRPCICEPESCCWILLFWKFLVEAASDPGVLGLLIPEILLVEAGLSRKDSHCTPLFRSSR